MMRVMKTGFLMLVLLIAGAQVVQAQGTMDTLTFDDEERAFYVHVPESLEQSPPLLIALHDNMSTGRTMALLTGLDEAADQYGFVAVYPDTSGNVWGEDTTEEHTPDDVGFIGALIDYMAETYRIDPAQVFLAGYDDGGLMAFRLACEVPELFDSIAVVGAHMMGYHRDSCPEEVAAPVNVLIANGSKNELYPTQTYEFTSVWQEERPLILGVADTLAVWAERNGCESEAMIEHDNALIFDSCAGDVTVAYYQVLGGGKNWPRIGPYQLNQFGVDMTEIVTGFFFGADDWDTVQPEPYEDTPRTYTVYLPSAYDPDTPMPVVLFLHGRFGNGAGNAAYVEMNQIAEANAFIGLYPDGLRYPNPVSHDDWGWRYDVAMVMDAAEEGLPDDTAFLSALIDDLAVDVTIDRQRIYVVGFSNGGFMVHRLACEVPELFAAYATVAGSGFLGMPEMCQTTTPVSMIIIHGTADDNVRWEGIVTEIAGRSYYTSPPIPQVANFWGVHNACEGEAQVTELPQQGDSPETSVVVVTADNCAGDSEVVLYGILNGGHNWPGIERDDMSNVNMDIHATQVVWDFFSRHALAEAPEPEATDEPQPEATDAPEPEMTNEPE